jgi:N-acetylglucosaminyl-diphospho-decaprenol L-rhamnosyltransferase
LRTQPDLSIVVVAHNGRERVLQTATSALAAAGGLDMELLVVDNGSTDGTPEALERLDGPVRVLRNTNTGFAAGNNLALPHAHGRYVLLLNPDVDVVDGSFEDLVEALDERPAVGAASVIQRSPAGTLLHTINRFPTPLRDLGEAIFAHRFRGTRRLQQAVTEPYEYSRERAADWLVGAFLVVRAEALAQVGPLDERFFLYSEETDWCLRLWRCGWEVRHLPVMTIVHHEGGYRRPELAAQLTHSKVLFARKHSGKSAVAVTRSALALRHVIRLLLTALPALSRPGARRRAACERRALAVALGVAGPPFEKSRQPLQPT